jgi:hypothetical protein
LVRQHFGEQRRLTAVAKAAVADAESHLEVLEQELAAITQQLTRWQQAEVRHPPLSIAPNAAVELQPGARCNILHDCNNAILGDLLQLRAETIATVWKPPKQQAAKADCHQNNLIPAALPAMALASAPIMPLPPPARASAVADEVEAAGVAVLWRNTKPAR